MIAMETLKATLDFILDRGGRVGDHNPPWTVAGRPPRVLASAAFKSSP